MNEQKIARLALDEQQATCVVCKEGTLFYAKGHGIRPLLNWLEEETFFRGAVVADRVIGKAAALLLAYGGVRELYAHVISDHAARILEELQISFSYGKKVPYIINRAKTGMCPMEQRVLEISDPSAAYNILKAAATRG